MTKIGLISDTHGFIDPAVFKHFANCDEIWHAGDIGTLSVVEELNDFKPLRIVTGNIDGQEFRSFLPAHLQFELEGVKVVITHIGGTPGKYSPTGRTLIEEYHPGLFICGHSHILKVIYDPKNDLLHINPGAIGNHGWHKVKTMIRFNLSGGKITELEIIEIPRN